MLPRRPQWIHAWCSIPPKRTANFAAMNIYYMKTWRKMKAMEVNSATNEAGRLLVIDSSQTARCIKKPSEATSILCAFTSRRSPLLLNYRKSPTSVL